MTLNRVVTTYLGPVGDSRYSSIHYEAEISEAELGYLALKAFKNKTKKAKDGPVLVRITGVGRPTST